MNVKASLLKLTWQKWNSDHASNLGAALAYYAIFSLVPLILLLILLLGLFLRDQLIQDQILSFFEGSVGAQSTQTIQSMMSAFSEPQSSFWESLLTIFLLIFGATGVVNQLQFSFNQIWNVELKKDAGIKATLKKRLTSFMLIGLIGLLILASFLISATLALASNYLQDFFPRVSSLLPLSELLISFGLTSVLFMAMFRYLPDVKMTWKAVWRGGLLTGFLFFIGKFVLTWYFSRGNIATTYGAAGSLLIILLWVYYSSLILLFGAQYTYIWMKEKGIKILPSEISTFQKEKVIIVKPGLLQKLSMVFKVLWIEFKVFKRLRKIRKKNQKYKNR